MDQQNSHDPKYQEYQQWKQQQAEAARRGQQQKQDDAEVAKLKVTTFHIRIAWLYLARGEVCCLDASPPGDNESVILPVRTSRRVCFSYLLCYVSWVSSLFVIVCTSKCYSPGIQFCASSYASRVLRIFVYTTLIPGMFLVPASLRFRFIVPSWIFVMRCRWKC